MNSSPPTAGGATGAPLPQLIDPSPIGADAVDRSAPPEEPIDKWRVAAAGYIMGSNGKTFLYAGKILDPRIYDIENIKSQGIKLEPYTPEQA